MRNYPTFYAVSLLLGALMCALAPLASAHHVARTVQPYTLSVPVPHAHAPAMLAPGTTSPTLVNVPELTIYGTVPHARACLRCEHDCCLAPAMRDSDEAHVARLMRSHMACGETHTLSTGGAVKDCTM